MLEIQLFQEVGRKGREEGGMEGMRERMREGFREGGEKNRNKIGRWRWSRGRNKREGQIEGRNLTSGCYPRDVLDFHILLQFRNGSK